MSNLNQFKDPKLKMIKSRVFEALGVLASYNTLTLEATTKYIRIITVEGSDRMNYTLTLDGTVPNVANTDAFQFCQFFMKLEGSSSAYDSQQTKEGAVIFEIDVSGGESLKLVFSSASTAWSDESSGNKKLLIEQYTY